MAEPATEPPADLAAVHDPACYICNAIATEAELVLIFGRPMCRDRVDCYRRYKGERVRGPLTTTSEKDKIR